MYAVLRQFHEELYGKYYTKVKDLDFDHKVKKPAKMRNEEDILTNQRNIEKKITVTLS
jgi:hypothetical protein